ncbi:MAG: hypothetical protein A2Y80_01905 [Deltaproteobacteria bacterium RBG_13_58_19]|nr:MAG: hypothetical protein A2Y80_01905 [Deltaproteobacteria bacterium RBG_13_58_19]
MIRHWLSYSKIPSFLILFKFLKSFYSVFSENISNIFTKFICRFYYFNFIRWNQFFLVFLNKISN